ncbi:hypothetical protein ACFQZX_03170 [Mucilaginibacter litoreus]|uniref:DUF1642 domain-containing protein n=1 Tax=Mucilaginibacter litoreus TaxID=1048221 RepID=A0ABW3AQ20_9SPHI
MTVAKIIRHRHKYHHYMNDDLKEVKEETHFKIVFSDPDEMDLFKAWIAKHEGEYNYNKEESRQEGKFPKVPMFDDEICWCDIMTYYLVHVAGYNFYSVIEPYKGEVYVKENADQSATTIEAKPATAKTASPKQQLTDKDMEFVGNPS